MPLPFKHLRIRTKLTLAVFALVGLGAITAALVVPSLVREQALEQVEARALSIATMTAFSAAPGLVFEDPATVAEAVEVARQDADLRFLRILDTDGEVVDRFPEVLGKAPPADTYGDVLERSAPVLVDGAPFGEVQIGLSLERAEASVAMARQVIVGIIAVLFVLSVGLMLAISTVITRPLHAITRSARRLADGHLDERAPVASGDEVGTLARAFNHMAEQVEAEIAARTLAEERMAAAKQLAERATEAKSLFLANMSHEIRTPMNGIVGMTGLLGETPLSDAQREFVDTIRASGDNLLTIINDVLDFSKIEAGQLELETQPFAVRACVEEALDLVALRTAEKGIELVYHVDEAVPAVVSGDVVRVRQILVNLLSNAAKFTETGEIEVRIAAASISEDDLTPHERDAFDADDGARVYDLRFSVRDTGIGIPPDRMDRLFSSFSQVDASTTRRFGGTGLGLAISRELAEAMGGDVWAESEEGVGSTFRFRIRVAAETEQAAPTPCPDDASLGGRRLLIVDDNATNRRILSLQAARWGMVTVEADSGPSALRVVEAGPAFDLAILDMQMPDMDGVELAKRLAEVAPALPLVLLSSIHVRTPIPSGLFAARLSKPVKQGHLCASVRRVLAPAPPLANGDGQAGVAPAAPTPESAPLQILVAEDNAVNQRLIRLMLDRLGHRADVVSDGAEVLDMLAHRSYDVVLMDLRMPQMGGLEATRLINERWPADERPCIVALTADVTQQTRRQCAEHGMVGFLSKPVTKDSLADALAALRRELGDPDPAGPAPRLEHGVEPPPADALRPLIRRTLAEQMDIRDDAAVDELIAEYVGQAHAFVRAFPELHAAAAWEQARDAAHAFKGASAMLGLEALRSLGARLEDAEPLGEDDLAEVLRTIEAAAAHLADTATERLSD